MPTLTPHNLEEEAITVPLRNIEKELNRRVKAIQEPGDGPVLRARMSNLIIVEDQADEAATLIDIIPAITAIHPSLVFLLVTRPSNENGNLTGRLSVRERIAGGNRTAASECIILTADGRAVDRLPYAVRALSIGNLPTNVWWSADHPPAQAGPILDELTDRADQLVYDSQGWVDPAHGLLATAGWVDPFERKGGPLKHRVASDLTWRRLKLWRRLLGQALDPAVAPLALETIQEVELVHGPRADVAAWLLAGWLVSSLGWNLREGHIRPGTEVSWTCSPGKGPSKIRIINQKDAANELLSIRITCAIDQKRCILHGRLDDDGRRLLIQPEGLETTPRSITVPVMNLATLIGTQLSDREHDTTFIQSLHTTGSMARLVLE